MLYSDNPIKDHYRYEAEREKQLQKLPKCSYCHDFIQEDFYFEINGEVICETCMDRFFKKDVDDYVG